MNKNSTHKKSANYQARKNGFTLVELLFACVLLGFMLTITLTTFIGVFRFYTWARTTRTTQEAARQVLNTVTREVQARKIVSANGSTLCLKEVTPTDLDKSFQISLNAVKESIESQVFATADCSGTGQVPKQISADNVAITGLSFAQVNGPGTATPTATSVTIDMQVTNGTAQTVIVGGVPTKKCAPSDNFCDQASFTTAAMQR